MEHVIDTLTEYKDTYKELIDNEDIVTLPIYIEKHEQYFKALSIIEKYVKNKSVESKEDKEIKYCKGTGDVCICMGLICCR